MDNKRVEQLEIITQRLMRRAGKRSSALITPYPISNAVFGERVEGIIIRYMFPCDGVITKGMVRLDTKPKNPLMLSVKIFNDTKELVKGFALEKKVTAMQPDISIVSGDCLELSLDAKEEIVTGAWVSLLWKPTTKDVEVKSFLIEEMENDLQEREGALTT